MRIFALAIGGRERASSRLRVWDHLEWLGGRGHQIEADSVMAAGATAVDAGFVARLAACFPIWLGRFFRADAILLQESMILWPAVLLKNLGKPRRVVFDFSDPVDRIGRRSLVRRIRRRLFGLVTRGADAVVIENGAYGRELASRAVNCVQFYGPVDVSRYQAARTRVRTPTSSRPLRLGWTGSPGTFGFIAPLMPVIDTVAREHAIELFLIGVSSVDHVFEHAQLTLAPWTEASEFELVPTFDLGLFRIEDSEDALWRGAGKLFIYLAAGVPFVATDRGIARDVIRESGVGFAVADDDRWLDALSAAVSRADLREAFAERSLGFARDNLSYERYRAQLAGLLEPPGEGNRVR
jgi:glycosyltransferase involved in cell wall biosynthesis